MNKPYYEKILFSWSESMSLVAEDFELYLRVFAKMHSMVSFSNEFICPGIVFHVVNSGKGIIEYQGAKLEANAGSMFIFWPDNKVKYYDIPGSPWDYTWFWLAGKNTLQILNMIGLSPEKLVYDIRECSGFKQVIASISGRFESRNFSIFYPMTASWMIVDSLMSEISDNNNIFKLEDIAMASRVIIENSLITNISVDSLAKHFGVNRTTFFRLFKKSLGISPKEYIEKFKFEKACQLLSNKRLSIKEIAYSCGFTTQGYFSTAFSRYSGISPTQWRSRK